MSDTEQTPATKSAFTDKEERVLKIALLCLKSGPPDIDIDKLVKLGGFNTAKTATNTWGVIKKKLLAMQSEDGEVTVPASATKPKATSKKRGKAAKSEAAVNSDEDDEETASPKKKAKATPKKKKQPVKAESDEEADGEKGEETMI